jgi:hypothetical protein
MIQTIKEQIKEYKQQFYHKDDTNIFYKLEGIGSIVNRLQDEHKISVLDATNLKREINDLMNIINKYCKEKRNV